MELCLPHQDNDQIWNGYLSQQKTRPDTRILRMYELGINSTTNRSQDCELWIFRVAWPTKKLDTVPLRLIGVNFWNQRVWMCGSSQKWLREQKLTTVAKKAFKKRDAAVGGNLRRVWFPGWRERYQDFAPSPSQDTKSQVRKCPLPQVKPTRQGLIFRRSGGLALVEKWWRSIARYPPGFSKGEFSERWKNSNFGNYFQLSFWTV